LEKKVEQTKEAKLIAALTPAEKSKFDKMTPT